MSEPTKLELAGIFRPRDKGPGFGIPVFIGEDCYWVQRVGDDGRVEGFTVCEVEPQSLRSVPQDAIKSGEIGQPALYSFEATDGTITVDNRDQLRARLRDDVSRLQNTPFVLADVANFLGDARLEEESAALCQEILSNTRTTKHPTDELSAGVSSQENQTPRFLSGDVVQRVNQPDAIGIVRESRWDEQAESWNYSVQFGAQLRVVPEEGLREVVPIISPWQTLFEGSFAGREHFIFTLTYHRLRRPPTRIAFSFGTSRTQFYSHQFKPLLKFMDSPSKRLLIADDVGLGKTIEAGYILRELQARQSVERILVLVPARLVTKWKRELLDRFNEPFDIVKKSNLLALAERLRQGREPEPFRWIVSYESARPEEVRESIDETQLPIDVLIADEAHRMRNPDSLQHRLGTALCRSADTVVFLSATPVQNKLEDLWHLLRLLSPAEFTSWPLFQNQIQSNSHLIAVQKYIAQRPADFESAKESLNKFFRTRAGRQLSKTEMARSINERLFESPADRRELVALQTDIATLSPIAHIISRTRKVDALANRPVRDPRWYPVALTELERKIYESVEALCRLSSPGSNDSWGFHMKLMMAYRMTASCIPAAMQYFTDSLNARQPGLSAGELMDEVEEDNERPKAASESPMWTGQSRVHLNETVQLYSQVQGTDSKLDSLLEAFHSIWDEDDQHNRPRRKIVVFSYFRKTLEYLAGALREQKIANRMIHGGVAVADREVAIDEFLERSDVFVLLTSEVGGEGIDLQRASVVVNYDLPWNPMVVEQRIGRVDRIGQEAARIIIVNLVVKDSIEERILERLLKKIDIFKESVGELDPIVGEQIERLTTEYLRGDLSQAELDKSLEATGNAIARSIEEARKMLSRVDSLLTADQGLVDEINATIGERQIPSEQDLLLFLNAFLADRVPGCQIPTKATSQVVPVDFRGHLVSQLERASVNDGPEAAMFAKRIMGGPIQITLSRDVAYRHPRAELFHLRHSLVRFAVADTSNSSRLSSKCFCLKLARSNYLTPGNYIFATSIVEIFSYRATTRLIAAFAELDGNRVWGDPDETTPFILEILDRGESAEPLRVDRQNLERAKVQLQGALNLVVAEWNKREQSLDEARRQLHHAALVGALELRVQREQDRLSALQGRGTGGFPFRMAEARLSKASQELDAARSVVITPHWDPPDQEEIAVGILRIGE
jgi:superfamily II DNA or RNA helicase